MTSEVVSVLAQDAQGVIWAGTEAGLHFFDGHAFVPFLGKLPSPMVLDLLEDPDGSLWVATQGGLARLHQGKVVPEEGLPEGNTQALGRDDTGCFWVLTSRGLRIRLPQRAFAPAPPLPVAEAPSLLFAHPTLPGAWVAAGKDLFWWDPAAARWKPLASPPMSPGEVFLGVAVDGTGQIWVRTARRLWRQPEGRAWQLCRGSLESGFSSHARLERDSRGWVWFDEPSGLWRGRGEQQEHFVPRSVVGRGALVDRDGGIWLRTQKGVAQVMGGMRWRSYGTQEGLPSPTVWLSLRDPQGRLWVSTEEGLCVAEGARWRRVLSSRILSIVLGEDGTLWASGSPGGTVHQIDLRTLAVRSHRVSVLPVGRIVSGFALDGEGRPWVADAKQGLARGRQAGRAYVWERPAMDGLELKGIRNLAADPEGRILVAHEEGIAAWHRGAWSEVPGVFAKDQASNMVFSPQGDLVVSYMNRPVLTRHRLVGDAYQRVETLEPFTRYPQMMVFSLGFEPNGSLWMGTSQGAARLSPGRPGALRLFNTDDGLVSPDCDEGSLFVDKDRVWIGTSQGLASYRTDLPEENPPLRPPLLLGAESGGEALPIGAGSVVLPVGVRNLELRFFVPTYQLPGHLTYQARLAGVDSDWISLEGSRIRYPAINPGRYLLELRGVLENGTSGPPLALRFEVPHRWWESNLAVGCYAFLGGAMVLGLVRFRQYRLEARNRELAEEVARQTQAVQSASQAKSAFLANMSHELRTPLNAILLYSELLQEDASEHGLQGIQEDACKIYGAGKHLLGLIDDILDVSKIEAGHMRLNVEEVEMAPFLADLVSTLEPVVERNGNLFRADLSKAPARIQTDPVRLRQVLSNLLGNAGKFTENGEILLRVEGILDEVYFTVRDSGIGMSQEELQRVFQEFVQAQSGTTRKYGGTGLGLTLVRRFTALLGGGIEADSEPGRGTTFIVRLPIAGPEI
jgi:signal transduction histidine kinase/ligand-binding sensor domain-containing protein